MIHSFLLIGQSNAAGRGFLAEADPIDTCDRRLKTLRNGRWQTMFRPINPDRPFSGISFAESFAKAYADAHPGVDVGIIPCADGGTEISQWLPGGLLFDNAVNCTLLAQRTSILKGILWHQGESDCSADKCSAYAERFVSIMDTLRTKIGKNDLPILVGGLGDFLSQYTASPEIMEFHPTINSILQNLGDSYRHCVFVSAVGLGANPDNLHFSATSLKELGKRYYNAFRPYDQQHDEDEEGLTVDNHRTAIELL